MSAVDEARKALRALYLAVPSEVAADVGRRVEAAFAQVDDDSIAQATAHIATVLEVLRSAPTASGGSGDRVWQLGYNKAIADAIAVVKEYGA